MNGFSRLLSSKLQTWGEEGFLSLVLFSASRHAHLETVNLCSPSSVSCSLLCPLPYYSCCHPHRTSDKCADSGCRATPTALLKLQMEAWKLPIGRPLKRGGSAAAVHDHMCLCKTFVNVKKGNQSAFMFWHLLVNGGLVLQTRKGQGERTEKWTGILDCTQEMGINAKMKIRLKAIFVLKRSMFWRT